MGIPIESGHKGQINMYLVVDNALAGVLTMRYQTTKNTYKAMRLMRRMHMNAVLAVRDFNISRRWSRRSLISDAALPTSRTRQAWIVC